MSKKAKKKQEPEVTDASEIRTPVTIVDPDVQLEFAEAGRPRQSGARILADKLGVHNSESPALAAGDIDAAWDQSDSGDELPGGSSPTPDQNGVEDIGIAMGLSFEDDEPVDTPDKVGKRDRRRWELTPASAEDFAERQREEDEEAQGKPPAA